MLFSVSHRGTFGVETIEAATAAEAIEKFREKNGKWQSIHPYVVQEIGTEVPAAVVSPLLPAEVSAPIASDAPSASVADTPAALAPKAAVDPTLADMGIVGENAELLTEAGLSTRSTIIAYVQKHGSLEPISGVGPASDKKIKQAVRESVSKFPLPNADN